MKGLQAQYEVGRMDQLISFKTPTHARDSYGGIVPDIDGTNPAQYRAQVQELSDKEAPADTPQDKATRLIKVIMRSLGSASNPTQSDKLIWNYIEYDIIDIRFTARQRFMTIDARYIHTGA